MAHDERNFRSTYYEKVGFRSVEEKKSLEILLKDKPLDRGKLRQFCLRFTVPSAYRNLVWKILLDVIPTYVDCQTFIMEQRSQEYKSLLRALQVMHTVDYNTPKPQLFYAVWLLQTNKLHFDMNLWTENSFVLLVQSFMQFFEDDTDTYWLTKCFYDHIKKFEHDYAKLIECTWGLLEKEDPQLYKHLVKHRLVCGLPLEKWFDSCFSGILNEMALGKIWDKLCGGSCKILVFVVIILLTNQRHKLLKYTDTKSIIDCLKNIPEETAEVIANKSIEMWQQHGSPLTMHDKPK